MRAFRTFFDGEKVFVPEELRGSPPSEVILVIEDSTEKLEWTKAQEASFAKAWDNPEDAVYDTL
jgi:hypothetical protein